MSKVDDGGPAFPIPLAATRDANGEQHVTDAQDRCVGGMPLRDYFAAKAMQAMITSPQYHSLNGKALYDADHIVLAAYVFANKMLEARK